MITKGERENGRKEIPNEAITRFWRLLPSDRSGVVGLQFPLWRSTVLSLACLWRLTFSAKKGQRSTKIRCGLICVCAHACWRDKHTRLRNIGRWGAFCFADLHNPYSIQVQYHHSLFSEETWDVHWNTHRHTRTDNILAAKAAISSLNVHTHKHRGSGPHFWGAVGLSSTSRSTAVGWGSAVSTEQQAYCPVYCLS